MTPHWRSCSYVSFIWTLFDPVSDCFSRFLPVLFGAVNFKDRIASVTRLPGNLVARSSCNEVQHVLPGCHVSRVPAPVNGRRVRDKNTRVIVFPPFVGHVCRVSRVDVAFLLRRIVNKETACCFLLVVAELL